MTSFLLELRLSCIPIIMQSKVFEVNISDESSLICKLSEADLTSSSDVLDGKCEANFCLR